MIQENRINKDVTTGSFQSGQLINLLKRLKKDGLTGELNISSRDGDGFIALYRGYITTVFSPGMYATLKENLTQQWLLGETQIKDLIEIQKIEPNNILESRLIKKGYISAESLCRVLKSNSELVLKSMFSWSGLYRFYEDTYVNVPEEILIDIEKIEEYEEKTDTRVFYNKLFSSVLKMASNEKNLSNEKVRETLDTVSKRLEAFKPKEVVVVVDENTMTGKILTDGLIGFGFEAEHLITAHDALE